MVMRSTDRILVLQKVDPKKGMELLDPKLITGGNKLHAVMDTSTALWFFRYDHGIPPMALRDRFSSFNMLKEHADQYFKTRNIKITEVID